MRKHILVNLLLIIGFSMNAQSDRTPISERVWRVNFLNPAVELELAIGENSTFTSAIGIGYGGGYPELTDAGNGFIYVIAPFFDLQQKWFYNFAKRSDKGKVTASNSGNFVSLRGITRGNSIAENVNRTTDFDFAFGPTWGIQRKLGAKFHLLFDIGPQYYFDTKGNWNIWPLMLQLNLGFDLTSDN